MAGPSPATNAFLKRLANSKNDPSWRFTGACRQIQPHIHADQYKRREDAQTEARRITKFPRTDVVNVLINISDIEERHAAQFPEKRKPDFLIHDQQSIAGLK